MKLNFSDGWVVLFRSLWNFWSFKTHKEGGDADNNALEQAVTGIIGKIK